MSRWKKVSALVHSRTLAPSLQQTSYTFTPNKEEVIESRFRLRYSTTCNSYYRDWLDAIDPSSRGVITGWEKALYSVDSVRRHVNEDIGQVYLERVPGSSTGCVKWRMDFGCCGLLVDEVTIRLSCVEDFGGEIIVTVMGSPGQKRVRYAVGSDYVTYTELENSPELTLTVHFVGEADQVTQLFPQNILRGMGYPLDIQVILKPPLQSLGRPRILVGLLYSSSQEIEVDSRHYKQNTSNQSSQGFLHIHMLRGRDLPQGKHSSPETFSKCYLLPDAKKTTKCRTKPRKGKDPFWNEQFLVVGINYHEIKRRALEICIADSHTSVGKKAKFIGGVRLSLGYKAIVSAQTKQVNQVLCFLKGKGGVSGGMALGNQETGEGREAQRKVSFSDKDTVIENVTSSSLKWKQASRTRVITESSKTKADVDEEDKSVSTKGNAPTVDEGGTDDKFNGGSDETDLSDDTTKTDAAKKQPQSVSSSSSTERMTEAWDSVPDPAMKSAKDLGTSLETCDDGSKTDLPESGKTQTSSSYTVQNTTETSEVSCDYESVSVNEESNKQALVQQRLFHSLMTSIKQLEFASRLGAVPECSEEHATGRLPDQGKESEPSDMNSCDNDNDFEQVREVSSVTSNDCQQEDEIIDCIESHEMPSEIPENNPEQETNDLKSETLKNGDLAVSKGKDNGFTNAESGDGNSPNSSECSRTEDDQRSNKQNGSKPSVNPEDSKQQMPTTEEFTMKASTNNKFTPMEVLEGKKVFNNVSGSRHQEINTSLESENPAVHEEARKVSTTSNEMKRSPSFTLRDLGKKFNLRQRSKTSEDEERESDMNLDTNANKVMLDAEGLEITQWKLMVERPKEWHYCWHILRSEMTILH